jgi:methyltransferase (TIGR00027 family)
MLTTIRAPRGMVPAQHGTVRKEVTVPASQTQIPNRRSAGLLAAEDQAPSHAPLLTIGSEELGRWFDADTFTTLLREQVPLAQHLDLQFTDIGLGSARARLPLNVQSTNQHFTHQASVVALVADYTGGLAVASVLAGWPVLGVHPVKTRQSMSLWLVNLNVRYLRPSVGELTATASLTTEAAARVRARFLSGRSVVETVTIDLWNGLEAVARVDATYFAKQTDLLRGTEAGRGSSVLYDLRLTSSAEMIAGVRAQESGGLFEDPYAREMAGPHGAALAKRFCDRTPQLGPMVAARTKHLDQTWSRFLTSGGRQIVTVGVGFDMRAFRLPMPAGAQLVEIDLPSVLEERRRRLDRCEVTAQPGTRHRMLPVDTRRGDLAERVAGELDLSAPTLVVCEGLSMYLDDGEVRTLLGQVRRICRNPDSRLWMDFVSSDLITAGERLPPSARSFMRGMQVLGEPFVFGTNHPEAFLAEADLRCLESVASDAVVAGAEHDPIFGLYRFCIAAGALAPEG